MLWWIRRWTKEHGKFCDTDCLLIRVVVLCWSEWWFFVSLSGALLGHSRLGRNSAEVEVINDSTVLVSYIFIQLLERHASVKQWSPSLCLCLSLSPSSLCLPVCISFCLSSTCMKMCVYTMKWTNCRKIVTLEVGFFKLLSVVHLSLKVGMMVTSMQLCSLTSVLMTMTGNKRWRCYCVWHRACWRVYCSFTSLSMTMTLCVTLGMSKSVLFIDITFNDHDTVRDIWRVEKCIVHWHHFQWPWHCVWHWACWRVLFIHITFNDHDTVCDIRHVEKCNVHSHHFHWPWHCVWHCACWKVYCSFTSVSMTMTLCVTLGVLKSVLFIHITFIDHDTVCDIGRCKKCIVHSHHFQWPWQGTNAEGVTVCDIGRVEECASPRATPVTGWPSGSTHLPGQ